MLSFFVLSSCADGNEKLILAGSIGKVNKILVVLESDKWQGKIGNTLREFMGELVYGLPQPETILSVSQVDPKGFNNITNRSKSILIIQKSDKEGFFIKTNQFAAPQTIIYAYGKNEERIIELLQKNSTKIINTFRKADVKYLQRVFANKRIDDQKYKTLKNLKLSLTIPNSYRTVDDTGEFLWLRQHLKSGIARGDGTNNILVYSTPLPKDISTIDKTILPTRDTIGKKYIPGSKKGMYMITEAAFTPKTKNASIADKKAFVTRGKWEVKNDFMAGPFLNYTIIDEENDRIIVFEGFTYAPSVNKREFIFELEAIAKSLVIQ